MNRVAECCCGKLTIEVTGEPKIYGICHCDDCKKRTGSFFGVSSYFNDSQILKRKGKANCYSLHNSEKNHDQKRYFCELCGTTLFWTISTMPDLTGISGGCFVQQPLNEPTYSVSHSNKCSWLELPKQWTKKCITICYIGKPIQ